MDETSRKFYKKSLKPVFGLWNHSCLLSIKINSGRFFYLWLKSKPLKWNKFVKHVKGKGNNNKNKTRQLLKRTYHICEVNKIEFCSWTDSSSYCSIKIRSELSAVKISHAWLMWTSGRKTSKPFYVIIFAIYDQFFQFMMSVCFIQSSALTGNACMKSGYLSWLSSFASTWPLIIVVMENRCLAYSS